MCAKRGWERGTGMEVVCMYWICSIGFVSYFFNEEVRACWSDWIVHFLARSGLDDEWRVAMVVLRGAALGFILTLVL